MDITFNGKPASLEVPNICPHCHVRINPTFNHHVAGKDNERKYESYAVWICSSADCRRLFITQHKLVNLTFLLQRTLTGLPKGPEWPKPILELSNSEKDENGNLIPSKFIKTYLQSLEAEHYGLDELAGMGYRKAIEYLVKDWAKQNKPEEKDKIESNWLGMVIKNYYVGDLKEILERASWLGNDHTHYDRLFKEFDINILKELIDLIMVELDREYKKAHYIEAIKKKI